VSFWPASHTIGLFEIDDFAVVSAVKAFDGVLLDRDGGAGGVGLERRRPIRGAAHPTSDASALGGGGRTDDGMVRGKCGFPFFRRLQIVCYVWDFLECTRVETEVEQSRLSLFAVPGRRLSATNKEPLARVGGVGSHSRGAGVTK
jgi:hypothetical protein